MATRKGKTKRKAGAKSRRSRRAGRAGPGHSSKDDKALRRHLLSLLSEENAHVSFDKAIANFPIELRALKPEGVPYSAGQLMEHLRIAQWDILEFSRSPRHVSPNWPEGYWPATDFPPNDAAWDKSVKAFRADSKAVEALVRNPSTDFYAKIPHGQGQTILREVLLVADHNAYHIGQLVMLRRLLGAWAGD